jgi:sugar phosphate permease
MGISVVIFSFNKIIYLTIFLLMIEGLCEGFFTISANTILQKNITKDKLGGVITFKNTSMKLASIIALMLSNILLMLKLQIEIIILIAGLFSICIIGVYFVSIITKNTSDSILNSDK